GTENSSSATVPSSGSIADEAWELAGNPYAQTIGWDDVTQNAVTTSCYVYDDAKSGGAGYISWNGSTGSLTDGLIAPFQGFWVQGDGGTGSITIATADQSNSTGPFYRTMNDSTGSMSFSISSGEYTDQTFVSFMNNGEAGMDNADAYKLLPMSPSERVVGISYADGNGLDISNLPYSHEGSISIPLDIMYLTLDENYNFVTEENEVTMSWDLSSLPETVTSLTLTDNTSGSSFNLDEQSEVTFTTVEKGSFPAYGSGGVNIYPEVGASQFTLSVAYSALTTNDDMMPKEFALHPAYPNPFNPSTTISFDIPAQTHSNASLRIYDITGRLVATLVDEQLAPGTHTLQWQPVNLSSGLYIVQLKAGEKIFNQKITFIK
ncbi:MAG: T9SS type A sorting domain-containing protein, partial [Candidatus Marinimicrobia bacterium]|nr:T9SS type A sorting domain-containing protein [Candidatus Neomarinimicrobiota bacterium]